jgi:hypothetical protein
MKVRGKKRDEMSAEALKRREIARRKVLDMKEAKEMGLTYEEYKQWVTK